MEVEFMQILVSILLVVIGLSTGVAASIVFNNAKENNASKKAEVIIEKAKKDAEKAKRESLFEAKEEIHRLKLDAEKEIKEKKLELKQSEDRLGYFFAFLQFLPLSHQEKVPFFEIIHLVYLYYFLFVVIYLLNPLLQVFSL